MCTVLMWLHLVHPSDSLNMEYDELRLIITLLKQPTDAILTAGTAQGGPRI